MSILEYLKTKGYTEDELKETEIRLENEIELPEKIIKDIKKFIDETRRIK